MSENNKEFWTCTIGPIKRDLIPYGGDFQLRKSVQDSYMKMLGEDARICSSGWGCSENKQELLSVLNHQSEETLIKLINILKIINNV